MFMLTRPLTWLDAAPESWPGSCGCALGVCALQRPRSPQGCPRDHSRGSAFPPFCLAFHVGSTRTAPGLVWFPSPLFLHSLPGPLPHTPATAQASGAGQQERDKVGLTHCASQASTKKDAQLESCKLSFIWGKMRTAAREAVSQIAATPKRQWGKANI